MSYPKAEYGICSKCGRYDVVSTHHRMKQKKWARLLYKELLDCKENLRLRLCNSKCHKDADTNDTLTEIEFCRMKQIMPRSEEGIKIWNRLSENERWVIEEQVDEEARTESTATESSKPKHISFFKNTTGNQKKSRVKKTRATKKNVSRSRSF